MFWSAVLPFFVTVGVLFLAVVGAMAVAPRMGWRRGRVLSWAVPLANREAAPGESLEQRLRGLHNLYKDGLLTEEEYRREKQELLDRA